MTRESWFRDRYARLKDMPWFEDYVRIYLYTYEHDGFADANSWISMETVLSELMERTDVG